MLKVKLVPMTLLVPVIDNSGDHDCKMDENRYRAIHAAVDMLDIADGNLETVRQGVSQNASAIEKHFSGIGMHGHIPAFLRDAAELANQNLSFIRPPTPGSQNAQRWSMDHGGGEIPGRQRANAVGPTHQWDVSAAPGVPVSQVDPPIDTTVRDSEMRPGREPEMTLEELRERPERTKTPPRPRANSWRHSDG